MGQVTNEKVMRTKNNFYTRDLINQAFRDSIGDYSYGYIEVSGVGKHNLKVGKFCSIAGGVRFLIGGNHDMQSFTTYPFSAISTDGVLIWPETKLAIEDNKAEKKESFGIEVGNDVWIGCSSIVLSGVKIGDGAVIGAGCVVAKNVNPYEIVIGNPIRTLKYRFTPQQIEKLLKIKWWDFDEEKLVGAFKYLHKDIDEFIKKYENLMDRA
jgi:acetyltransferase-like isoleucine patch superfamily enzyme